MLTKTETLTPETLAEPLNALATHNLTSRRGRQLLEAALDTLPSVLRDQLTKNLNTLNLLLSPPNGGGGCGGGTDLGHGHRRFRSLLIERHNVALYASTCMTRNG